MEPIYQWPYRPEMQFSLFDLQIAGRNQINNPGDDTATETVTLRDLSGTISSKFENYNELFSLLLTDDPALRPALERFGADRELVFHLGKQEVKAFINQSGQIQFQAITPGELKPEDWLTLSLYQSGDAANKLFEYKLDLDITEIKLKTEYKPERKYDIQLLADETAFLLAKTEPVGRNVTWSIVRQEDGVLIAKFDKDTGEIRLHPESEPDKTLTVRATDSFNPYVYRDLIINCQVCAEEEAGGKKTGIGSVDATFSLGVAGEGASAGKLYIAEAEMSKQLYTPKTLKLSSSAEGVTVLKDDATDAIRQLLSPQVFVSVEVVDKLSYTLKFYKSSEVAGKVVEYAADGSKIENYHLRPGVTPYVTYIIANPDAETSATRLRITETRSDVPEPVIDLYTWLAGNKTWMLSKAGGLLVDKQQTIEDGQGITTKLKTVEDSQGIASTTRITSQIFPWGDEVVKEVIDPNDKKLTTTSTFYEV